MANRWRKFALILLLVLFLLQVGQSSGTNDSAHMQETAGVNNTTVKKGSGGGRSGGGGQGGSSGHGGGRGSDGTSSTPDGRIIPLIGGGLAGARNGGASGHRRHNAASRSYSCSLPMVLATTALGAVFLAL